MCHARAIFGIFNSLWGGGLNLMEFDSRMMMVRYPVTDFRRYLAIAGREIIIISNNWSYALALRF